MMRSVLGGLLFALSGSSGETAKTCAGNPVAVQILGSGGPAFNSQRASASYLLWVGPQAKLLFDIGGGAHLRFSQAGAKFADLAMIGISHLHPDHTSDLPALMWASNPVRRPPLPIVGPSGNNIAPDFKTFLARLFDEKTGAFQVLGSALAEQPGVERPRIEATVVDVSKTEST